MNVDTNFSIDTSQNVKWKYLKILWVIAFISGLIIFGRDTSSAESSPIGIGVIHRVLGISIIGIVLLKDIIRNTGALFRNSFLTFTLFGVWQITTTFWSVYPFWTLYRSIEYFIVISLTAYTVFFIRRTEQLEEWVNIVLAFIALLLISVWIGVVLFPSEAFVVTSQGAVFSRALSGVYPRINPNAVATFSGTLSLVCVSRYFNNNRRIWVIGALITTLTMVLAQGRSAMAGFACGLFIILYFRRKYKELIAMFILLSIGIAFFTFDDFFWEFYRRGQSVEQFSKLSGRGPVWEYAYDNFIIKRPFIGFGSFAGGRFLVLANTYGWSTLHSAWVETAVGSGFIGVLLLLLVIVRSIFNLLKTSIYDYGLPWHPLAVEIFGIMGLVTVRSIFSVLFTSHNDWLGFCCIGVSACLTKYCFSRKYFNWIEKHG